MQFSEHRSGHVADVNHNQGAARTTKGKFPWNYEEADLKLNSQVAKISSLGTDGAGKSLHLKQSRQCPFLGCPVRGEACIHFHLHQEPCLLSAESVYQCGYRWQCAGHPSRVRRHGSRESPLRPRTTIPLRDVSELRAMWHKVRRAQIGSITAMGYQ
jgi:hypothetical protein